MKNKLAKLKYLPNNFEIIEAGDHFELESCEPYSTTEMEQKYKYGGLTPSFYNPKISYVEGGCVGGGSEVNSGFYHRAPNEIVEDWKKKYSINDFSNESLLSHYKIIEEEISVSHLPDKQKAAKASLMLKKGADKLGWKNMEVPRWFNFDNNEDGIKQSMTKTYIKWYLEDGGRLLSCLKAKKIKRVGKEWLVICIDLKNNKEIKIKAKTLFLCSGAVSTPFLLRSNGIKKNIGNSLQMHPTIKIIAQFDEEINSKDMGVPVHQVKEYSPDISIGCSISSKPYLALAMLDNVENMHLVNKKWKHMAIYYAAIKPTGFGKIRKIPFFNDPFVTYNLTEKDLKLLSTGLKKMCRIVFNAGAKYVYPSIKNYGIIKDINDLKNIPKAISRDKTSLMTIHLFSSCPMGEDREICAANSFGKVFDVDNLYINDGYCVYGLRFTLGSDELLGSYSYNKFI